MRLILLTHPNELAKTTNSGRLVQQSYAECVTIIWQRTQADARLLQWLKTQVSALVYPQAGPDEAALLSRSQQSRGQFREVQSAEIQPVEIQNYILLDSTWQQARKMLNHSPYLQALPRMALQVSSPSRYRLRRNQREGGLCTAECAIELLRATGQGDQARVLDRLYGEFLASG